MWYHTGTGHCQHGACGSHSNAHPSHSARPSRQDLRHALGLRLEVSWVLPLAAFPLPPFSPTCVYSNLRYTFLPRPPKQIPRLCVSGRQADSLGRLHDKQSARHSAALQLGHDLRLRPLGLLCRLRRSRQHMLHLQPEDARGQRARQPWTAWPHWLSLMLSLPRRQPNCHQLGWYDLVCFLPFT